MIVPGDLEAAKRLSVAFVTLRLTVCDVLRGKLPSPA